jgi:hypothetical protein
MIGSVTTREKRIKTTPTVALSQDTERLHRVDTAQPQNGRLAYANTDSTSCSTQSRVPSTSTSAPRGLSMTQVQPRLVLRLSRLSVPLHSSFVADFDFLVTRVALVLGFSASASGAALVRFRPRFPLPLTFQAASFSARFSRASTSSS